MRGGYRCFQVIFVGAQNGINLPENHLVLVFSKRSNTSVVDVLLAVGNDLVDVYLIDVAKTFTTRTGALR